MSNETPEEIWDSWPDEDKIRIISKLWVMRLLKMELRELAFYTQVVLKDGPTNDEIDAADVFKLISWIRAIIEEQWRQNHERNSRPS